jgi:glycosyltransferase involved in cell wall biosynthesis
MYLINQLGYGGAQRLILDLVRHIDRDRFEIVVAMFGGRRCLYDDFCALGVEIVDFGARGKFDLSALMQFCDYIQRRSVDILHAHLPYSGIVARTLGKLAGVPAIVYTEQNMQDSFHPLTRIGNRLTQPLSDVYTAITNGVEESFFDDSETFSMEVWNAGRRHFTIYSGVDIGKIDRAIEASDIASGHPEIDLAPGFNLACVARLHPNKGYPYLIRAMEKVKSRYPDVRLLILGDGDLRGQLEQMVSDLGLKEHISFLGYREDVYEILAAVDCFVLPSLHEGFGIAIAEAMAASKPVIATDIPAVREVVADKCTGLLVPAGNAEALAQAIIELIEHPDLVQEFGQNGRERVEKLFSIQSVTTQYELLYDLVVRDLVLPRRGRKSSGE